MPYCPVDGNPCAGVFCCPECRKYHLYVSKNESPSIQQSYEEDVVDELEFEEETYDQDTSFDYSTQYYTTSAPLLLSLSFLLSYSDSYSIDNSPLMTPKGGRDEDLKDIKFGSLFSGKDCNLSDLSSLVAIPQHNYQNWLVQQHY